MSQRKTYHRRTPYQVWLDHLLDDIFECAYDPDICGFRSTNALADTADLAWATVDLMENRITRNPQLQTVWKLCQAIGMDIRIPQQELAALKHRRHRQRKAS